MADSIVSLLAEPAPSLPYKGRLPTPFSAVRIDVASAGERLCFEYYATETDLVACGAINPELLSMPRRAKKTDGHGEDVWIYRRRGKCKIYRWRPVDQPQDLPGFEPWMIDAARAYETAFMRRAQQIDTKWRAAELAAMIARLRIVRTDGARNGLRLVVDNTRDVRP